MGNLSLIQGNFSTQELNWGPLHCSRLLYQLSYPGSPSPVLIRTFCITVAIQYQRSKWQPTPVFLPGKSHGRRSLLDCSPWGREESGTTERLHCHFSLSCIGEGNGNPLQCSCLENPRTAEPGGLLYGVAQSRTRLKQLSSSCSSIQYRWGNNGNSERLYFLGLQNHCRW